ncbi:MAG: helix-turn-helix domain-containing protein, partial [Chthoniobacterales bacterium]
LLFRMIEGAKPPKKWILIPPAGVVRRASSDVLIAEDPHVAMAIQFIRDHLDQPLKIQEVFTHVPMSRRTLQRRFQECVGHTLVETIQALKIERIKNLLISTTMSIQEITDASGFSSASYLTMIFRENVGVPPSEYRASFQCRSSLSSHF